MNDSSKVHPQKRGVTVPEAVTGIDFETAYSILFKVFLRNQLKSQKPRVTVKEKNES